ncbi:hypothetical protein CHELA1G11_13304 [Hyphomicrobiales bacterium]|nr:hypothetical protein CHELA1G2_11010 [Hyphomicrobiales bacterium]CAH1670727.1 hypothetical protein CHELA1G11_13304 [Hyphomicrobiales bacterium]
MKYISNQLLEYIKCIGQKTENDNPFVQHAAAEVVRQMLHTLSEFSRPFGGGRTSVPNIRIPARRRLHMAGAR